MQLKIIAVGTKMPSWVEEATGEYLKRIPAELKIEFKEIPLAKRGRDNNPEVARQKEGEQILAAITPGDQVVALEVGGKSWDTPQLAGQLEKWQMSGVNYNLLIGGPDGLHKGCLQRAQQHWSLSPLTLPHPLVRVVLVEQLYRAWTILNNHPLPSLVSSLPMNRLALKDSYFESRIYSARLVVALIIVLILSAILILRYSSLQITQYEIYSTQSDNNRVQLQSLPPKRGLIYDSKGELLAENRPSYTLSLVRERIPDLEQTLDLLSSLVAIKDTDVDGYHKRLSRRRPYQAVPLRFKLSEQEIATLAVNRYRLPGVEVEAQLVRFYPKGELFSHTVGYVGRINDVEQFEIDPVNYSGTHHIGKVGIEKYYEELLHGKVGYQNVETNAMSRVLRVLERSDPLPGVNLTLYLNSEVQRVAHQALGDKRGSVVALDTKSGGVIAMVSTPGFDSNLFVNGISIADYSRLRDSADLPLFNRSVQGQYPPGSTIKQIWALAGLHYGVIDQDWTVADPGWYQLPNDERLYRDWKKKGHGHRVGLKTSIEQSCDIYYYELAYKLGIDRLHEFAAPFGFGALTGIDITSERSGLLPSREWKQRNYRQPWFPGETVSIGIGQGYMLTTPLQLALATAMIANRGVKPTPRLVKAVNGNALPEPPVETIDVDDKYWQLIHNGMAAVVHGARGTGTRINRGLKYRMAGKTGTAQVIGVKQGEEYDAETVALRNRDHGLFVAFAPLENPEIAVAVVVENGEHGSWVAPIARKVIDAYLGVESG